MGRLRRARASSPSPLVRIVGPSSIKGPFWIGQPRPSAVLWLPRGRSRLELLLAEGELLVWVSIRAALVSLVSFSAWLDRCDTGALDSDLLFVSVLFRPRMAPPRRAMQRARARPRGVTVDSRGAAQDAMKLRPPTCMLPRLRRRRVPIILGARTNEGNAHQLGVFDHQVVPSLPEKSALGRSVRCETSASSSRFARKSAVALRHELARDCQHWLGR